MKPATVIALALLPCVAIEAVDLYCCPRLKNQIMTELAEKLIRDALKLDPVERIAVVEEVLSSLDRPDPDRDRKWAAEAEARLTAFRDGNLDAIPAEDVFRESGRT